MHTRPSLTHTLSPAPPLPLFLPRSLPLVINLPRSLALACPRPDPRHPCVPQALLAAIRARPLTPGSPEPAHKTEAGGCTHLAFCCPRLAVALALPRLRLRRYARFSFALLCCSLGTSVGRAAGRAQVQAGPEVGDSVELSQGSFQSGEYESEQFDGEHDQSGGPDKDASQSSLLKEDDEVPSPDRVHRVPTEGP
eukprot:1321798-Rhodomonas_salina.1